MAHGHLAVAPVQGGIITTQYAIAVISKETKGTSVQYAAKRIGITRRTRSWYSVTHVQGEWRKKETKILPKLQMQNCKNDCHDVEILLTRHVSVVHFHKLACEY